MANDYSDSDLATNYFIVSLMLEEMRCTRDVEVSAGVSLPKTGGHAGEQRRPAIARAVPRPTEQSRRARMCC
jgi:hypothetical protein